MKLLDEIKEILATKLCWKCGCGQNSGKYLVVDKTYDDTNCKEVCEKCYKEAI